MRCRATDDSRHTSPCWPTPPERSLPQPARLRVRAPDPRRRLRRRRARADHRGARPFFVLIGAHADRADPDVVARPRSSSTALSSLFLICVVACEIGRAGRRPPARHGGGAPACAHRRAVQLVAAVPAILVAVVASDHARPRPRPLVLEQHPGDHRHVRCRSPQAYRRTSRPQSLQARPVDGLRRARAGARPLYIDDPDRLRESSDSSRRSRRRWLARVPGQERRLDRRQRQDRSRPISTLPPIAGDAEQARRRRRAGR